MIYVDQHLQLGNKVYIVQWGNKDLFQSDYVLMSQMLRKLQLSISSLCKDCADDLFLNHPVFNYLGVQHSVKK
jgi:hypothetical protein